MSNITTEVVCADLRGEADRLAAPHQALNPDRAAEYRGLTFEPVSENEFRAANPAKEGNALLVMVLDNVEQKLEVEFIEHWENGNEVLIFWK